MGLPQAQAAFLQDGDEEACLRLQGLPTPAQAKALREVMGLPRYRPLSPERAKALFAASRPFKPK